MIAKVLRKIRNKGRAPEWKDIEYFEERWKTRIMKMAELVGEDEETVLDLGCGMMWLKQFLAPVKTYIPCDYIARGPEVIVCDFNKGEFPDVQADVAFVSGCLEYVEDPSAFFGKIRGCCRSLVLSYCTLELNPRIKTRTELGWKNHFSFPELLKVVLAEGFALVKLGEDVDGNAIMKFRKVS